MIKLKTGLIALALACSMNAHGADIWGKGEVPRITDPKDVPQTLPEMWKDYDENYDKNNPLEARIHKTWETQDGIVVNWVQLTVGTFQGKKSIVCGYWAYPKGAQNLPAIMNTNGGPQTGGEGSALHYARLGYACFNPNHNMNEKMGGEAAGLPNTDWGALNADSNPGPVWGFNFSEKTIDAVVSPRNNWLFPRAISGRRIITFMMQQPQVEPKKIGITGYSTGGSLTAWESIDPRLAAVVPQCGGCGGKMDVHEIITGQARGLGKDIEEKYGEMMREFDEGGHWKYIKAPVLLRGASNDFHCPDWNSVQAIKQVAGDKRYVLGANFNHGAPPEVQVADYLWFQDKLKGEFKFPGTPKSELLLKQADGVPVFKMTLPNTALKLKRVDMFYTDGRNCLTRFWITGTPVKNVDGTWQIKCPLSFNDEPLFAFANAIYEIDPIKAPNHSYNGLSEMAVSSDYAWAWPKDLQAAQIKPQVKSNRLIDDFARGGRDWTRSGLDNSNRWSISTRKINCPLFMGPQGAELVFDFNSPEAGAKIGVQVSRSFMEVNWVEDRFYGFFDLPKQGWNTVRVKVSDLHNPYGWQLDDWHKLNTLAIRAAGGMKEEVEKNWLPAAKRISESQNKGGMNTAYTVSTRALPDKVSGWNESYYKSGGDEYTKGTNMTPDDVFVKTRFKNMRWEGGKYVPRSKPYVEEKFVKPDPAK
jgi:cephalosporin-C deacetylase-like acetyl esterase